MPKATARIMKIEPDSEEYIDDLGAFRARCGRCGFDLGHIRYTPEGPTVTGMSSGWRLQEDGVWHPTNRTQKKRHHYMKETQQNPNADRSGQKLVLLRRSSFPHGPGKQRRTDEYRKRILEGNGIGWRPSPVLPLDMKCPRCPTINHVPVPQDPPKNLPW